MPSGSWSCCAVRLLAGRGEPEAFADPPEGDGFIVGVPPEACGPPGEGRGEGEDGEEGRGPVPFGPRPPAPPAGPPRWGNRPDVLAAVLLLRRAPPIAP